MMSPLLSQLKRLLKRYVLFNLFFLVVIFLEVFCVFIFFTTLAQSSLAAFALSFIFLTFFSFFIFRAYFHSTKVERFEHLKQQFLDDFQKSDSFPIGSLEHHVAMAANCTKLSDLLAGKEISFYLFPSKLAILNPVMEKLSFWYHWQDILQMRELFLKESISEYIKLVKYEPTNLEFHTFLANAYVLLASLYEKELKKIDPLWSGVFFSKKFLQFLEDQFTLTCRKAVEELKILNDFAPDDPWVHLQLAYSYHDLGMMQEETQEYEKVLKFNPHDMEILYKLGLLYFQQGKNARGLQIYQLLKNNRHKKAENLLKHYDEPSIK